MTAPEGTSETTGIDGSATGAAMAYGSITMAPGGGVVTVPAGSVSTIGVSTGASVGSATTTVLVGGAGGAVISTI